MRTRRSDVTVSPFTVAITAVIGAWLAHGLEYARVWGWDGFATSASRQVHTYMGPVGVVLLLLAFVGVELGLRTVRRLQRLVAGLSDGHVDPAAAFPGGRRFTVPITTLLSLVWTLQLVVYVAQENAELRALGVHQPVLNVISGVHLWAAGVHLVVAGALLAVLWLVHRPIAQLAELVREVVAWLLAHPGRRLAPERPAPAVRSWTPVERFGRQLWSRPPPPAVTI